MELATSVILAEDSEYFVKLDWLRPHLPLEIDLGCGHHFQHSYSYGYSIRLDTLEISLSLTNRQYLWTRI